MKKINKTTQQLALIVKDLIESDKNLSDIGAIIGCLTRGSSTSVQTWLKDLKTECKTIDEFIEVAKKRADIALISAAIEAATGYDYEETEIKYSKFPHYGNPTLGEDTIYTRDVEVGKTVRKRHAKKSDALLKFILINRLPEYFADTKKFEIDKRSINVDVDMEAEIEGFCGKLMEVSRQRKQIESKIIEPSISEEINAVQTV